MTEARWDYPQKFRAQWTERGNKLVRAHFSRREAETPSNCVLRQVENEQTVCVCLLSNDSREARKGLVAQSPPRAKGR